MAQQIAELPPPAIEQVKECALRGMDAPQNQKESMAAVFEKRKPKFTGR